MRLRLWRRRLTVSAPRMAIRSAVPWPLRWLLAALVLGFSAALALWAFEFGRDIAGLDRHSVEELADLKQEVKRLKQELSAAQAVADSAESLLTTERSAQAELASRIRQMEEDNRALRNDLGFFEQLLPPSATDTAAIRGFQANKQPDGAVKWQLLLIQPAKQAPEFKGALELSVAGTLRGKPWAMSESVGPRPVVMRQYLKLEGVFTLPPDAVVKTISAKLMQGAAVRSEQTIKVGNTS